MAKKSKTQKAKASAARQARKIEREEALEQDVTSSASDDSSVKKEASAKSGAAHEADKKAKKTEEKPKKKRFQFFRDVKSELARVTWPTRIDVARWTGVVVVALVFFGVFVTFLDNFVITPLLIILSGADPASIDWGSVFSGNFNGDGASNTEAANTALASNTTADASSTTAAPATDAAAADAAAPAVDAAPVANAEGAQ